MILLCFVSFCPRSCPDHDLGVLFDDDIQRIVIPCLIYIIVLVWPSNIYSIMKFINKILYKPASKRIICIFLIARAFVYPVTSRISLRKQSSNLIVRSLVPHKTNNSMQGKWNELVSTPVGDWEGFAGQGLRPCRRLDIGALRSPLWPFARPLEAFYTTPGAGSQPCSFQWGLWGS